MGDIFSTNLLKSYCTIECCNCGVVFAVSNSLNNSWLDSKKTFYCPNGHGQSYTKSTAEKLQEKLDMANKQLASECANHAVTMRKLYDYEHPKKKKVVKKAKK